MNLFRSKITGRSALPSVLIITGTLVVMVSLVLFARPQAVTAKGSDLTNAEAKYPSIVGTRIDSCDLCHTAGSYNLNPFGSAYLSAGRSVTAFGTIESRDSDGDSFTNLVEINALTFPGNPNDKPAAPAPTATPTRTALPTSTPTRQPTATNTPTNLPQATNTPTQPPAATNTPTNPPQPTSTPTKPPQPTNTPTNPPQATNTPTNPPQPTNTPTNPPQPTNTPTNPPQPTSTPTQPPKPTATPVTPTVIVPTSTPTATATPPPDSGSELVFSPSADAYVNKAERQTNYGKNTFLRVDARPNMASFLRFEIAGLNGQPVKQVILRLYANTGSIRGIYVRRAANQSWSENEITFGNAPDFEGKAVKSGQYAGASWITLDVTSLVKGEGIIDLVLLTTDKTQSNMASRETGDHAPQLIVVPGS